MSVSRVDRAALLEFKRDFLCWRGREFDERYKWRVSTIDADTVRIEIESEGLDFTVMVAEEIAFCLSEALVIAEQDGEFSATAAVRKEGSLNSKYRLSRGAWKFCATGVVDVKNARRKVQAYPLAFELSRRVASRLSLGGTATHSQRRMHPGYKRSYLKLATSLQCSTFG